MTDSTLLKEFETRIEPEMKWTRVQDIPDFPFTTFGDARAKIQSGEYATGADFTASNMFARWLYGDAYKYFFLLLASTPFIGVLVSIALSVWLNNYWLLFGVLLGFLGQFTSNPYNPSKGFFNMLVAGLVALFGWFFYSNNETGTILVAFYVIPFWLNRYIYKHNQKKLTDTALGSEKLFIYLYQTAKLGFKDKSGKSYWHMETVMKETEELLKKHGQTP